MRVTLTDADGDVLTGRAVTWTSSDPVVGSVSANGTVTGLALGTTTISATAESKSGSVVIEVIPIVAVMPRFPSLFAGDTTQLAVQLLTGIGTSAGSGSVRWLGYATAAGGINGNGLVVATAPGTILATAFSKGGTGTADVIVLKRPGTVNRKVAWRLDDAVRSSDGATISELWVSDPDGANAFRVSPADETVNAFALSPNGVRILIETMNYNGLGHSTMYVVSADGSVVTDLQHGGTRSGWSPDGSQIVFTQGDDLRIINADGSASGRSAS